VFFWEEPIHDAIEPWVEVNEHDGVEVVVPHLTPGRDDDDDQLRRMLDGFVNQAAIHEPIGWYWTPMMRSYTDHLPFAAVVWDCMDELTAFAFAPPELRARESEILACADVVFTGGAQLYESKRDRHPNVHLFPSSVDVAHFGQARASGADPSDQAGIGHPRLGWFGVIDERTDLALLDSLARSRPDWHIVMIGPVVKIAPDTLPRHPNLHWLGMKPYTALPAYIAHWDVAILPFALNDSTRFISPTKTPEYLAAGKPVVSTPITDVVRPYGERGLVSIADGPEAFEAAVAEILAGDREGRQAEADALLQTMSWDRTVQGMQDVVRAAIALENIVEAAK
jgi:UDP-galactopyranose mutase